MSSENDFDSDNFEDSSDASCDHVSFHQVDSSSGDNKQNSEPPIQGQDGSEKKDKQE